MNDSLSSKLINAISYAKSHTLDKGFLKKDPIHRDHNPFTSNFSITNFCSKC